MVGVQFLQRGIAWSEVAVCINWATWDLFHWHTQQSSFIQCQRQQYLLDSSLCFQWDKGLHLQTPSPPWEQSGYLTSFFFPGGLLFSSNSPCPNLSPVLTRDFSILLHASLLKLVSPCMRWEKLKKSTDGDFPDKYITRFLRLLEQFSPLILTGVLSVSPAVYS